MNLLQKFHHLAGGAALGLGFLLSSDGQAQEPTPAPLSAAVPVEATSPYAGQDVIEMKGGVMASFDYILRTGNIPGRGGDGLRVDWSADDAFIRSYREIRQKAQEMVEASAELSALRQKPSWSREDRTQWESGLGIAVSAAMDKIKGLDTYRVVRAPGDHDDVVCKARVMWLNDLSDDIVNGTALLQFGPVEMSVVEGMAMQEIERALLTAGLQNEYKNPVSYYHVSWQRDVYGWQDQPAPHSCTLSPATCNLFEAEVDPSERSSYVCRAPVDETVRFTDIVEGRVVLYNDYDAYGGNLPVEKVRDLRLARGLQKAQQKTAATDRILERMFSDPLGLEIRDIVKEVRNRTLTTPLRTRMKECLAKPGGLEKWNALLGEQFILSESWIALGQMAMSSGADLQKIENDYVDTMNGALCGPIMAFRPDRLGPAHFEARLHLADVQTEQFWDMCAVFAGTPEGSEILRLMQKTETGTFQEYDHAQIMSLFSRPSVRDEWEELMRRKDLMWKSWDQLRWFGGGIVESYERIHDRLTSRLRDMPEAARLLPENPENLQTFGERFVPWAEMQIRGMERIFEMDRQHRRQRELDETIVMHSPAPPRRDLMPG